MSMIRITSNSNEYLAALNAIPDAMKVVTAVTLTETAQAVTTRAERNVTGKMIVRTPYTTKSLVTYKASTTKPIARQNSISGTKSDYLPIHDSGGTIHARKKKIAIPTNKVRGADRKKKVPSRYRIDNMGSKAFVLSPTTADQNDAKNWGARKTRSRKWRQSPDKIFGRNRGSRGFVAYRLSRPAMFLRVGKKLVKVRDLSLSSVHVKGTKWHSDAVKLYGNYEYMSRTFQRNAALYLKIHAKGPKPSRSGGVKMR